MTIRYKLSGNQADWTYVRKKIFIEEQGFENEFDKLDEQAMHLTIYDGATLVGTCRGLIKGGKGVIGRLAVLPEYRHQGYGEKLVKKMETLLLSYGVVSLELHAQVSAQPFYEKLGYHPVGEPDYDEHVLHQMMTKTLVR